MKIKEPNLKLEKYPVLTWKRKPKVKEKENGVKDNIDIYYDCLTGIKTEDLSVLDCSRKYQIIDKKNGAVIGFYVDYVKKQKMVRVSLYYLETVNLTDGRDWTYMYSVCIDKDKRVFTNKCLYDYTNRWWSNCYTKINESFWCENNHGEEYSEVSFNTKLLDLWQVSNRVVAINSNGKIFDDEGNWVYECKDALKPFRDMFGTIVPIAGNKMVPLVTPDNVNSFLSYKEPLNTATNKGGKKLEELLKYKLDDVKVPANMKTAKDNFGWAGRVRRHSAIFNKIDKFAVIQKVKDATEPLCVLRSFFVYDDEVKEGGRIYVSKNDIVSSRMLRNGTFMYQKLLKTPENWDFSIETFNKEETSGTILEYFGEIVEGIDYLKRGLAIWSFICFPITEQIYKSGGDNYMKKVFNLSALESPLKIIEKSFGVIYNDGKNLYEKLGINRYQFKKTIDFEVNHMPIVSVYTWYCSLTPIRAMKKILTNDNSDCLNISSVDNNTFDIVFNMVKLLFKNSRNNNEIITDYYKLNYYKNQEKTEICDCMSLIYNLYNINVLQKIFPVLYENRRKEVSYRGYRNNLYTCNGKVVFLDVLNMIKELNYQSRIKPYFNTLEELSNMHEILVELINNHKNEIEMEKWNTRKKSWEKYKFSDEDYTVLIPEKPDDLATEGIELHHCVKSYIGRVSNGSTNIAFIRENDFLSKPFYTVEIDNNNIIQQVHGQQNCNATQEVLAFVKKWAKKKNLSINTINKVR